MTARMKLSGSRILRAQQSRCWGRVWCSKIWMGCRLNPPYKTVATEARDLAIW